MRVHHLDRAPVAGGDQVGQHRVAHRTRAPPGADHGARGRPEQVRQAGRVGDRVALQHGVEVRGVFVEVHDDVAFGTADAGLEAEPEVLEDADHLGVLGEHLGLEAAQERRDAEQFTAPVAAHGVVAGARLGGDLRRRFGHPRRRAEEAEVGVLLGQPGVQGEHLGGVGRVQRAHEHHVAAGEQGAGHRFSLRTKVGAAGQGAAPTAEGHFVTGIAGQGDRGRRVRRRGRITRTARTFVTRRGLSPARRSWEPLSRPAPTTPAARRPPVRCRR